MSRRRCMGCLSWIRDDEACYICSKRTKAQQAGSAPEHKRRVTTVATQSVAEGHPGKTLHAVATRHPSEDRNGLGFPCFAHRYPSALNCPRCIENSERDWEERDGA